MKRTLFALLGSTALLAACGDAEPPAADPADMAPAAAPITNTAPMADAGPTEESALGLTEPQLLDADLIGADNQDLGDIEGVVRGPDGAVTQLLVEIDDSEPDRFVHIPLDGLETVQKGNDWDLRSALTRDQLMAMPEVTR